MSSAEEANDRAEQRLPRETSVLYGHVEEETALLHAYRSGRFAHAWLLTGPAGVGKATLAFRMARFVLAHPDHKAPAVQAATSLHVDENHPVARRMAAQAHGDVLLLERTINEKTGKLRQDIQVDEVRRTVTFFGSTPAEGGWRVAIVDSIDELNPQGANALLKVLEEPPRRALLLLVNHCAGRVLATIRSRCRLLTLRPLSQADVAHAAAAAIGRPPSDADVCAAAEVAEGSVRRALGFLDGDLLDLRNRTMTLLVQLPALDPLALHALGDRLSGTDAMPLTTFVDSVNGWLAGRVESGLGQACNLDRLACIWQKFNSAAAEVAEYNLDRKPLVFKAFGWLAAEVRR